MGTRKRYTKCVWDTWLEKNWSSKKIGKKNLNFFKWKLGWFMRFYRVYYDLTRFNSVLSLILAKKQFFYLRFKMNLGPKNVKSSKFMIYRVICETFVSINEWTKFRVDDGDIDVAMITWGGHNRKKKGAREGKTNIGSFCHIP